MAMPAIIDSATVYRVFMIPSHSPAEHQRPGPLEIMPRSRATRNDKRLERATIVPSYDGIRSWKYLSTVVPSRNYVAQTDVGIQSCWHWPTIPPALIEDWRRTPLIHLHPESALGRAALTKQVAHIDDIRTTRAYRDRDPRLIAGVELGGYRTVLSVPMLKDQEVVGLIVIYRQEVRLFTNKQVELVKSFASQAVIA